MTDDFCPTRIHSWFSPDRLFVTVSLTPGRLHSLPLFHICLSFCLFCRHRFSVPDRAPIIYWADAAPRHRRSTPTWPTNRWIISTAFQGWIRSRDASIVRHRRERLMYLPTHLSDFTSLNTSTTIHASVCRVNRQVNTWHTLIRSTVVLQNEPNQLSLASTAHPGTDQNAVSFHQRNREHLLYTN